jgi:hypothetical protein
MVLRVLEYHHIYGSNNQVEAMEITVLDCGSGCCGFDPHQAPLDVEVSYERPPGYGDGRGLFDKRPLLLQQPYSNRDGKHGKYRRYTRFYPHI